MPDSSGSQIPAIRTFQLDATSLGDMSSSVNLFRGDVNLTQSLFTMPGRTSDQGLAVSVALLYQSNVYRQATSWNRDAPTSTVGLGFTLPLTAIVMDDGGSPTPGLRTYSYSSNGSQNTLAAEPASPFLFSMPAALGSQLANGRPVPPGIIAQFAARGLVLDTGAVATTISGRTGQWSIADEVNQQLFTLVAQSQSLEAYDGGQSFQLTNYQFWKIIYYPTYERWSVTTESGQVMSFGGIAAVNGDGTRTSLGSSIEWGVRWAANGQNASWAGPSTEIANQQQFARAWHIQRTANVWGDKVQYAYNELPVDPQTGLIPGVEQRVGAGGMPYTKACYLTGITDVFGRKATFSYADKLWDDTTPESPREYADPHKPIPNDDANAYQDKYETKYLSAITVADTSGATLFGFDFNYMPRPEIDGPGCAVANVTDYTGVTAGDTYKRYLTAIVMRNADGSALPGLEFAYYLDPGVPDASPGALATITKPQGGTATYRYTAQSLAVCDREQVVPSPLVSGTPIGGTPRCWFGTNYAVTTWYDAGRGRLSLQVFTWLGRWELWQIDADNPLIFDKSTGLDLTTLDVITSANFFAIHFRAITGTEVYLFRKDVARPGQWVPAVLDGKTTGLNQPTLSYGDRTVSFTDGQNFLIVGSMSSTGSDYAYDRITWRWTTASWNRDSFTLTNYTYFVASQEYYCFLDAETGAFSVIYLDPALDWQQGTAVRLAGFPVSNFNNIALASGASLVAVSQLVVQNIQTVNYTLSIVQWDETYALQSPTVFSFQDRQEPSGRYPTAWRPMVVTNDIVAVAAHMLRFNSRTWLENSSLYIANPAPGLDQRYAYGPDYTVQIVVDGNGVAPPAAKLLGFDPNINSAAWPQAAVAPAQPLTTPPNFVATANWPSSGQSDFLTLGQYLYFRGNSSNWQAIAALPPLADVQALVNQSLVASSGQYVLNAESVIDESPTFLSYAVYDTANPSAAMATAIVLRNGEVFGSPQDLLHQRIAVAADPGGIGPGQHPGGPSAFFSYPDTAGSFGAATQFTLYYFAGDAVQGNLLHYAVTGLTLADGYHDPWATAYAPDPASAACDPTGLVVKYYRSVAYPGASDPSNPIFGSVANTYLNGLHILTGANFYDMLDGLLSKVETYDAAGALVSGTVNTWTVYVQRASAPDAANAETLNLYGGFVCQVGQDKTQDGVLSSQTTEFIPQGLNAPYSGQPVRTVSATDGGEGTTETFVVEARYGYDLDPVFKVLHILTAQLQTTTTWTPQSGAAVPMQSQATAYTPWPSAAGPDVVVPAPEADFSWMGGASTAFPFSAYQPGQVPNGWLSAGRITGRTLSGLVSETVDGCGVAQSTLYGNPTFPVAQFVNASLLEAQCAYWGFEPYETGVGFTLRDGVIVADDAHTGEASLRLPPCGTASLAVTVTPANVTQTYLLGFWYKTEAGFEPVAGAGWAVSVTVDGAAPAQYEVNFADTGGVWAFKTLGIPLTAGQRTISLGAVATNTAGAPVLLDAVFIMPLQGAIQAKTFDAGYNLVTSTMDAGGRTTWTQYDRFQRVVAIVGSDGQTKELSQRFLSREGNVASVFDPAIPNADLTLHPAAGGMLETFRTGSEWSIRWAASGAPAAWAVSDGSLLHQASTSDTLTWRCWPDSPATTAALLFEVVPSAPLAGKFGITFGAGYSITYDPAQGYSFTAAAGTTMQAPLGQPPAMAEQWLLVMGCGVVLFFGDGQLLFSQAIDAGTTGSVMIDSGPNLLQFRNLALVAQPRLGLAYSDAAGRQRQLQQLMALPAQNVSDARISAIIYDALDRQVAVTRAAPASFGQDAGLPLLVYHPNFSDIEAFIDDTATTWLLRGDVSDYYRGQADGAVHRSDDQGYSYRGYRSASAPLNRQVERGLPGRELSIHDVSTTTPAERQTVQFSYAANGNIDPSLPPGKYSQKTVTGPLKSLGISLTDTAGRQVFSSLAGESGSTPSQTGGSASYVDTTSTASGGTLAMKLPNYYTSGPQTGQADYVSSILQDPVGRTVSTQDPSSNTTRYIYDPVGRVRFIQPQLDPGRIYFVYNKYDPLGRVIEQGIVPQTWDADALQVYAADLAWPGVGVPHTVSLRNDYDGDGNDQSLIGQKTTTITENPSPAANPSAGSVTVSELFAYNPAGQIEAVTMTLAGAASESGTIVYGHNNLNEVTRLDYPEQAPLAQVVYTYDDQGKVVAIGSSTATPDDFARYTYTADGEIQTETRNAGTLIGSYQYNSPGWLQQLQEGTGGGRPFFVVACDYNADATLARRSIQLGSSSVTDPTSIAYAYDGQRRLTSAVVAGGKPGNEAIDQYDANGNIWTATLDGADYGFTLASGSDRLQSADLDGTKALFAYSADGWLTQGNNLAAEHDACLGVTTNIAVSGATPNQVRLAYAGQGQRVVKSVTGSTPSLGITFCGAGRQPVAALRDGVWLATVTGPNGVVAIVGGTGRYFALRDMQRTVWGAVDDQNALVASFNYSAFGTPLGASGPAAGLLGYRFMGQGLDAETGLYDYQARMYDPVLRRFYSPDSAHQYPSTYLFVGNDPLTMVDPSGNISLWAQIGIGVAMAALAVAGVALSFVTFGAAAPEVAAGEVALGGALAAGEAAGEIAAAGAAEGAAVAGEAAAAGAIEGASAGAEVAAGVAVEAEGAGAVAGAAGSGAAEAASTSSTLAANLGNLAIQGASGALTGAGTSGLQYDYEHGKDFSAAGFFEALGIGAASGLVSGPIGGIPGLPGAQSALSGLNPLLRAGITIGTKALAGGISGDVSQLLTNAQQHQPWSNGLASAFGLGFAKGAAIAAVTTGGPAAFKIGASRFPTVATRVTSLIDRATVAAKSTDAIGIYMTTGVFLVGSYVVWGAADNWGQGRQS